MRAVQRRTRHLRWAVGVAGVAVALVGCGGGAEEASPSLAATGAWARPTPATADEGVVYLTVTTDEADAVVGASVPAEVAEEVQLHQTTGGGAAGAHDHGAVADGGDDTVAMGEVAELAVAPDEPLVFEPGGSHVMLVGLAAPLEQGDAFELTLELASGRTLEVDVPVRTNPPG